MTSKLGSKLAQNVKEEAKANNMKASPSKRIVNSKIGAGAKTNDMKLKPVAVGVDEKKSVEVKDKVDDKSIKEVDEVKPEVNGDKPEIAAKKEPSSIPEPVVEKQKVEEVEAAK